MSAQAAAPSLQLVFDNGGAWQCCEAAPAGQLADYAAVFALCARTCAPHNVQVRPPLVPCMMRADCTFLLAQTRISHAAVPVASLLAGLVVHLHVTAEFAQHPPSQHC